MKVHEVENLDDKIHHDVSELIGDSIGSANVEVDKFEGLFLKGLGVGCYFISCEEENSIHGTITLEFNLERE